MADRLRVTIVVPTRDRAGALEQTVGEILKQCAADDDLIVADDSPSGSAERAVTPFGSRVRLVRTDGAGLAAARNLGVRSARTELVLYCDDDVTPADGWIDAYREAFQSRPDLCAAGGPVRPIWGATLPAWIENYLERGGGAGVFALAGAPVADVFGAGANFHGCNMAFRTSVLRAHPFPPELVGAETIGSGDTGLLRALHATGAVVATLRAPVVYHRISADRLRIGYFRRWARHLGGTLAYEEWRGKPAGTLARLRYIALTAAREGWKIGVGFTLWWSRSPRSVDRQIAAIAVLEKIRYAAKLGNDPLRRAAVTEAL